MCDNFNHTKFFIHLVTSFEIVYYTLKMDMYTLSYNLQNCLLYKIQTVRRCHNLLFYTTGCLSYKSLCDQLLVAQKLDCAKMTQSKFLCNRLTVAQIFVQQIAHRTKILPFSALIFTNNDSANNLHHHHQYNNNKNNNILPQHNTIME